MVTESKKLKRFDPILKIVSSSFDKTWAIGQDANGILKVELPTIEKVMVWVEADPGTYTFSSLSAVVSNELRRVRKGFPDASVRDIDLEICAKLCAMFGSEMWEQCQMTPLFYIQSNG